MTRILSRGWGLVQSSGNSPKRVKAVKLCNTRCVEIVEETSFKGLDARMPCPRKDRVMVIKGTTVMEDKGVPLKKGLTTKWNDGNMTNISRNMVVWETTQMRRHWSLQREWGFVKRARGGPCFVSALWMSREVCRISDTVRLKAAIQGKKKPTRVWRGMARFQKFPGWYNMQGLHSQ